MEMAASPVAPIPAPATSKLWNIIRIVVYMLKKGIAKSKPKLYLNLLVKRGKILACKAIMLHQHYTSFTCRSQESHLSFISPSDYEFSCSNTPKLPFHAITSNNISKKQRSKNKIYKYDDVLADDCEANSPAIFPGLFGKSPIGRKLRVTDSPFMLKEEEEDGDGHEHVDKAAEEFIKRFYIDLNLQKRMAASDSPYSNFWDR